MISAYPAESQNHTKWLKENQTTEIVATDANRIAPHQNVDDAIHGHDHKRTARSRAFTSIAHAKRTSTNAWRSPIPIAANTQQSASFHSSRIVHFRFAPEGVSGISIHLPSLAKSTRISENSPAFVLPRPPRYSSGHEETISPGHSEHEKRALRSSRYDQTRTRNRSIVYRPTALPCPH